MFRKEMNYFKLEAKKVKNELINLRREFHKHPEIGMEEYNTSKLIKDFLAKEGIGFTIIAKTGICGVIIGEKDKPSDRVIALRADMDALPIEDKKNCSYASKVKGKMHACGHDAHMAILLMTAKLLNENKCMFSGIVKLIFEPAEETIGGSRIMIEEGVLENPNVDVICGLHVEETLEYGKVMVKAGVVNAASNPFKITIKGFGGHGAYPHTTVDPIVIASNVVTALQNIISREINPTNSALLTVGSIHGGTAPNIIPEQVELKGIIRTFNKDDRIFIKKRLVDVVEGICRLSRGDCNIEIEESYPSLHNDEFMTDLFKDIAVEILGEENVVTQKSPKMGVESFSYFANERPAVFYFLGVGNKEKNIIYPAHSSLFDIDENSLILGVALQCQLAIKYLTRS